MILVVFGVSVLILEAILLHAERAGRRDTQASVNQDSSDILTLAHAAARGGPGVSMEVAKPKSTAHA